MCNQFDSMKFDVHYRDSTLRVHKVVQRPQLDDAEGKGLAFVSNEGETNAIFHQSERSTKAIVWVSGAHGGFDGVAHGLYPRLSQLLLLESITSLRVDYRIWEDPIHCPLDALTAVGFLKQLGYKDIVLVGCSFGGSVVIGAGAACVDVKGVVSLCPQTLGSLSVSLLTPRPILIVHGWADERLPVSYAMKIYGWAKQPKKLVLFQGAGHAMEECQDELDALLLDWIPKVLNEPSPTPG